jgi:hypothetical protein
MPTTKQEVLPGEVVEAGGGGTSSRLHRPDDLGNQVAAAVEGSHDVADAFALPAFAHVRNLPVEREPVAGWQKDHAAAYRREERGESVDPPSRRECPAEHRAVVDRALVVDGALVDGKPSADEADEIVSWDRARVETTPGADEKGIVPAEQYAVLQGEQIGSHGDLCKANVVKVLDG